MPPLKPILLKAAGIFLACLVCATVNAAPNNLDIKRDIARVGPDVISLQDYLAELREGMKDKFFHGKAPDKETKEFRQQTAQQMVERALYLQEAQRRGIQPDKADVDKRLVKYDQKKKKDAYFQEHKDQLLKEVRKKYERESVLKQLEAKVRDVLIPADSESKKYYSGNPDKFTAPERVKVSIIMLAVDPSAAQTDWDAAAKQATELIKQLRAGADFAEFARAHSGDDSAANGGDMGYIHKGMLGDDAAKVLDMLKPGEISEPVYLLQGVAILRLDDRENARLNDYDRISDRAKDLLKKDLGEKAWKGLLEDLRKKTEIVVNDSVVNDLKIK
jgi:parvulin-like peptidyl-prolyl isomerase